MDNDSEKLTAPRLWLVLARAYASMAHYIEGTIVAQGLGLSDFMVLEVLLHKGQMTISEIGEKVLLASASMTSAVDRLERRGLVERKTCSRDRRLRYVELTAPGKEFIEEIYGSHEKHLAAIIDLLSGQERRVMYEGLKKIGLAAKVAIPNQKKSTD